MISGKEMWFVAVKVFLRDGDKLLIFKDGFDQWDLPGGRIKPDEFGTPLEDIAERKMREELGNEFQYTLGEVKLHMRHERVEIGAEGSPTIRIFAVGYEATFGGGEIELASHHKEYEWVDVNNFKPEDYFTGGWLKGVQEYLSK